MKTNLKRTDSKLVIYGLSGLASANSDEKSSTPSTTPPTNPSPPSHIPVDLSDGRMNSGDAVREKERVGHSRKVSTISLHVIQEDGSNPFGREPSETRMRHDVDGIENTESGMVSINNRRMYNTSQNEPRENLDDQWHGFKKGSVLQQQFSGYTQSGDFRAPSGVPVIPPRTFGEVDISRENRETYHVSRNSQETTTVQDVHSVPPPSSYSSGGSLRDRRSMAHQSSTLPPHLNSTQHHNYYQQHHNNQYPPTSYHQHTQPPQKQHRQSLPTPYYSSSHSQQLPEKNLSNNNFSWHNQSQPDTLSQPSVPLQFQPQSTGGPPSHSLSQPYQDGYLYSSSTRQQQHYLPQSYRPDNQWSGFRYSQRGSNRRHSSNDALSAGEDVRAGRNGYQKKTKTMTYTAEHKNPANHSSAHYYQAQNKHSKSSDTWEEDEYAETITGSTLSLSAHPECSLYDENEEAQDEEDNTLKVPSTLNRPSRRASMQESGSMYDGGRQVPRHKRTRHSTTTSLTSLAQQYANAGVSP